jgi:hypothetical protein
VVSRARIERTDDLMSSTDARPGKAGLHPDRDRGVATLLSDASHRLGSAPTRTLLAVLACVQWILVLAVALTIGREGPLLIVVPQVVVLLPVALALVHGTALRLGGRTFAAWSTILWVALPFAGALYANPSLRHDYAHRFLPHLLGLADDPRFPAMVAFLAAVFFTLRALETHMHREVAIAVASAGLGAAFVPRAALVAVVPAVGLAVGGRTRQALGAAAALGILLGAVAVAVSTGLLSTPFAHVAVHTAGDTLASLSENFWSGRVIEWLAIAGVAGALRGRLAAGAMIGVALLAAFLSLEGAPGAIERNLLFLQALLPVWPLLTLAIASIPLLVPRRQPADRPDSRADTALRSVRFALAHRTTRPAGKEVTDPSEPRKEETPARWPVAAPIVAVRSAVTRRVAPPPADEEQELLPDSAPVRTPTWARIALACLFVLIAFVGVWNAARYPIMLGYDAQEHITYADGLIHNGTTPTVADGGEYYAPPGYYAVAGAASWIGGKVGLSDPHQAAQYLNVVFVLLTAALLLVLARLLFPQRPGVWVGSLAFFALLPVVTKTAAMFHPETLNMLLSTAAVTLATWMLLRRQFALRWLGLLALTLLAGQLVRASSLFTLAAIGLAFLVALATPSYRRYMPLRQLAIAGAAVVLIAVPWYVSRIASHKTQPGLSFSSFHVASRAGQPPFLGLSLDDVFNRPVRPFYKSEVLPETYTDIWGDWFGAFAWSGYSAGPSPEALTLLKDQSWIGILPTFLAIAGWLGIGVLALRRRLDRIALLPVLLLPIIAVGVYLWRAYVLTSPDGDLTKATYLLTTAPIWAIGFGLAADRLSRRRLVAIGIAAAIVAFGFLELRFILYGIRDHNPIF